MKFASPLLPLITVLSYIWAINMIPYLQNVPGVKSWSSSHLLHDMNCRRPWKYKSMDPVGCRQALDLLLRLTLLWWRAQVWPYLLCIEFYCRSLLSFICKQYIHKLQITHTSSLFLRIWLDGRCFKEIFERFSANQTLNSHRTRGGSCIFTEVFLQ